MINGGFVNGSLFNTHLPWLSQISMITGLHSDKKCQLKVITES